MSSNLQLIHLWARSLQTCFLLLRCGFTFLRTLVTPCVSPSEWLRALLHFCQLPFPAAFARPLIPPAHQFAVEPEAVDMYAS